MIGFSRVFALIDYSSVKSVPKSEQEHFNRLDQESNWLHCSYKFLKFGKNTLIDWNDDIIDYFFEIINYIVYLID